MCGSSRQWNARSFGVLFAVTLVRDVAEATHRNAQETLELDVADEGMNIKLVRCIPIQDLSAYLPTLTTQR